MRIILYYPKTDHEKFYKYYWIPYSILTVASGCIASGYDVLLIDANAKKHDEIFENITEYLKDTVSVGISCMTGHQIKNGLSFAKVIRDINSNIPIVWGGPHPTLFPEQCLNNSLVDFVVQGQGEVRFPLLVDAISKGLKKPFQIEGVGEKYNQNIYVNSNYKLMDKRYFSPFPWHLININDYIQNDPGINCRTINYVSSQGCPFSCGFCSEVALYQRKWTAFSTERVIEDIAYLVNSIQVNGIKFYDANFFVDIKRVLAIADRMKDFKIRWAAAAHPKTLMNLSQEDWDLLSDSGCTRILIGMESGSQKILDFIKKDFLIADAPSLAIRLSEAKIIGSFTFVVGFPNNIDHDDIQKTISLGKKIKEICNSHEVKIHFYAPYPETPLWKQALDAGFKPPVTFDEWSNYDYYYVETPWIDKKVETLIHNFNKECCPYVHL